MYYEKRLTQPDLRQHYAFMVVVILFDTAQYHNMSSGGYLYYKFAILISLANPNQAVQPRSVIRFKTDDDESYFKWVWITFVYFSLH